MLFEWSSIHASVLRAKIHVTFMIRGGDIFQVQSSIKIPNFQNLHAYCVYLNRGYYSFYKLRSKDTKQSAFIISLQWSEIRWRKFSSFLFQNIFWKSLDLVLFKPINYLIAFKIVFNNSIYNIFERNHSFYRI